MEELLNDLDISTLEELHRFMIDNPKHPLVKQLNTFYTLLKNNGGSLNIHSEVIE